MPDELWRLDATALSQLIRTRQVSARDAAASVLARIADVNPRLNALAEVMADQALAAADACDHALATGLAPGLLHGVPVTVKVNVDTAGHASTDGIVAAQGALATSDSPLVAAMRREGAVIVGRSNTPAFSLRWFTDNDLHGRTLNPFDATVTPGGSSGGAAVAVASGMGPIAHGNDYGGSIRHPAWACGVVGLRTSLGRVPSYKASAPRRGIANQMMSVQGPLTRTLRDARLALGWHRNSPRRRPDPKPDSLLERRFSLCRDWAVFLEPEAGGHDLLLMPVCWDRQFPIDADKGPPEAVQRLLAAQSPLLGTAMLGLPGLALPTGLVQGLPVGVQLVAGRLRDDRCLAAGELIERAAGFSALELLAPR